MTNSSETRKRIIRVPATRNDEPAYCNPPPKIKGKISMNEWLNRHKRKGTT